MEGARFAPVAAAALVALARFARSPERLRSSAAAAPAEPRPAAANQPPGLLALCPHTASLFGPFFQTTPTIEFSPLDPPFPVHRSTSASKAGFSAVLPSLITYFLCQILVVSDLPNHSSTATSHASSIDRALSRSSSFCPKVKSERPGSMLPVCECRGFHQGNFFCCHNYPNPKRSCSLTHSPFLCRKIFSKFSLFHSTKTWAAEETLEKGPFSPDICHLHHGRESAVRPRTTR